MRESEERFRHTMSEAADIVYVQDEEGRLVEVNRAACRVLGYSSEELLRMSAYDIVAGLKETDIAALFRYLERRAQMTLDVFFRRRDGTTLPAEARVNRVDVRGERHVLVVAREIAARVPAEDTLRAAFEALERRSDRLAETVATLNRQILERRRTEQELIDSRAQLRALSTRLLSVQEEERRRIAREIHDELGQTLTTLHLRVGCLGDKLADQPVGFQSEIQAMSALVDKLLDSVQTIASNLRPSLLDDLGLVAALEWQVNEFREHAGVACSLNMGNAPSQLDSELSTAIFRIVQESLTNVARHARANHVRIKVAASAPRLVLTVRDDGRGIAREEATAPTAFGLLGMKERVRQWHGALRIRGVPGKGTVLRVEIPLPGRAPFPAQGTT